MPIKRIRKNDVGATGVRQQKGFFLSRTLEAEYYQGRVDAAEAKREAAKTKREAKEKLLRDIAYDLHHGVSNKELRAKYSLDFDALEDVKADILMLRY